MQHNPSTDDILDRAIEAIQNESNSNALPMDLLESTKIALSNLTHEKGSVAADSIAVSLPRSQSSWKLIWAVLSIAASVLIGLGIFEWVVPNRSSAFATMVEQLQIRHGVAMRIVQSFAGSPPVTSKVTMDDKHIRSELGDGDLVNIIDLEARQSVILAPLSKKAQLVEIDQKQATFFHAPLEQLRHAKGDQARSLGHERINGKATEVFQVQKTESAGLLPALGFKVWVDIETKLPVKIVVEDRDPKSEMKLTLDQMDWSVEISPASMAIEIPKDYEQVQSLVDQAQATEPSKDLPSKGNPKAMLLSGDRVPRAIVWEADGTHLNALVTDPESIAPTKGKINEIQRWSIMERTMVLTKPQRSGASMAAPLNGSKLVASSGREIRIVDAVTQEVSKTFISKLPLPFLAMNASGQFIAAANADWQAERNHTTPAGFIQVWNTENDKLVCEIADDFLTTFVALSPDGSMVLSCSNSGSVKLWRTSTGELIHMFDGVLRATFSPDGRFIAFVSQQLVDKRVVSRIQIYELNSFQQALSLDAPTVQSTVLSLTYSADGTRLAAGSWDGQLLIWSLEKSEGGLKATESLVESIGAGVHALAFSPDGSKLASGSEDGALQIWEIR